MPKLSIITINWNNAEGLKKTIESVINQTSNDFEYIVIDGASTDKSIEFIKQYASKINYWISEKDNGIYNAMNKGILKATGEYCLFLNSGDWLEDNDSLKKAFSYNFSEEIVCFNLKLCNLKNEIKLSEIPDSIKFSQFYYSSPIGHPSSFINRELFNKYGLYNENNKIVSDWEFFVKCYFLYSIKYKKINDCFSVFMLDGISSTNNFKLQYAEMDFVYNKYFRKEYLKLRINLFIKKALKF